jgi:hypothetical protein
MMSKTAMLALGLISRANYAWTITKDCLGENLVGVTGPSHCEMSPKEIKNHPKAQKFRMKDDDGEIYCYGFFVDLSCEVGEVSGFEPLDDYGHGGLGATSIEYKVDGEYQRL